MLFQALPFLCRLLDETDTCNQLTESCQLYLERELVVTEIEALAYFNHYVIFPFLHCVEQKYSTRILKQSTKTDTLSRFAVIIPGINPPSLTNNLGKEIIQQMCEAAASAVQPQCGR